MYMEQSPRGRIIMRVEGNPSEITARGTEIELLGEQMREAAGVLKDIKTRSEDQQGKAIDTLRETIGDSYETLEEAAGLYEPVGPVIRKYGEELDGVQPSINAHADNCWDLWQTFVHTEGTLNPYGPEPEEGSEEASANEAKQDAYDAWELEAKLFDSDYDTWENAFDDAVSGITEGMSDEIEDGGWRTFLDWASTALGWAGLIVGVAALIIGGPVLGIIAAVIGVLSLAVVIGQAIQGDAGFWDVAIAAIGVVPVGKIGKLAGGKAGLKEFGQDAISAFKPSSYAGDSVYMMFKNGNTSDGILKIMTGETGAGWNQARDFYRTLPNGGRAFTQDVATSVFNQYNNYKGWYDTVSSGGSSLFGHIPESDGAAERVRQLQNQ